MWIPASIRYGIARSEFWNLNPYYMQLYQDEYIKKQKEQAQLIDMSAYLNGVYMGKAIAAILSKKCKYPDKPLLQQKAEKQIEDMSEEEYFAKMQETFAKLNAGMKE